MIIYKHESSISWNILSFSYASSTPTLMGSSVLHILCSSFCMDYGIVKPLIDDPYYKKLRSYIDTKGDVEIIINFSKKWFYLELYQYRDGITGRAHEIKVPVHMAKSLLEALADIYSQESGKVINGDIRVMRQWQGDGHIQFSIEYQGYRKDITIDEENIYDFEDLLRDAVEYIEDNNIVSTGNAGS